MPCSRHRLWRDNVTSLGRCALSWCMFLESLGVWSASRPLQPWP